MTGSENSIAVKVIPRSSRDQFVGIEDGVVKIKLTAPPVEGEANEALRVFLSNRLHVPKGSIQIVRGVHSRKKVLQIAGLTQDEVCRMLAN